jgi:steroid delta-isomerase-like uncharacterized protein
MSAANKALVRRLYDEVFHQGNLALIDELFSPSYVRHAPPGPEVRGRTEAERLCALIRTTFPDVHYTLEDMIAEGDKVVLRWSARGTHKGDFLGVAPTGKAVTMSGTVTFLIRAGKVEEEWSHWDALGLLQQIGIVPK